jgi:hypothetical protein
MESIKVAGKKAKNTINQTRDLLALHGSVKAVFDNNDGERVIRYLAKVAGLSAPRLTTDTSMLLIRQGQQQIVLTILKILGKDPQYLVDQIKKGMESE